MNANLKEKNQSRFLFYICAALYELFIVLFGLRERMNPEGENETR